MKQSYYYSCPILCTRYAIYSVTSVQANEYNLPGNNQQEEKAI